MTLLSPDRLTTALELLTGWELTHDGKAIHRRLTFDGFEQAFTFMTAVAFEAQRLDHHPDWSNSYATVEITLSTHSSNGVTELDVALADYIDKLYETIR